jgi:hypothetical protein
MHQYSLLYIESVFSDNRFITLVSVTVIDNPKNKSKGQPQTLLSFTRRVSDRQEKRQEREMGTNSSLDQTSGRPVYRLLSYGRDSVL